MPATYIYRESIMMRTKLTAVVFVGLTASLAIPATEPDARVYELRIYSAHPDKLDALNARFRDHTAKLFEKHGMTNVGYWTPVDNPDRKLIYMLAFPDRAAREKSWKEFSADADWKKVRQESEAAGPIVAKTESRVLTATDYSPAIHVTKVPERVFELRTYTSSSGNLDRLNDRFRKHTLKLFEKHGMTNVGYWTPAKNEPGAADTLIYLLAHTSTEAAKKSWDAFRADPAWIAAKKASEEVAGGSLTVPDGVKSVYLKPTDYSPMR
jgi:hypothetical protein